MYSNQLSTRELFSSNLSQLSERHDYTEGNDNCSHLQYEMMNPNSQEACNSQQLSSGSDSQDRRRFLDKYMSGNVSHQSRGHGNIHSKLLKIDAPGSAASSKSINFQHQLQLNKAKAKEKDERDLLSSVVRTLKECSEDVKYTLKDMQSILSRSATATDDKLSDAVFSISENVQKNYEKMIAAVQEREENRKQYHVLENEIKKKDEQICQLQQQMKDVHKMEFRNVIDSIKAVVDQHQAETKEKLERLVDMTVDQLENQKDMIHEQREGQDQQRQMHLHIQDLTRDTSRTDDKRILDELLKLRQELDKHKYELENFCRDRVCSSQRQTEDLKKFMQDGLEENAQLSLQRSKQLYNNHCKQMKEVVQAQHDEMQVFIDQKFNNKATGRESAVSNSIREHEEPSWLGRNREKFSEYHESVPKVVQDRLDEMHSNHIKEIERIRQEINQRNEQSQNKRTSHIPPGNSNVELEQLANFQEVEVCQNNQTNSVIFKTGKSSTFISPHNLKTIGWTAKQLFSKSNPSPIATVYPQQKEKDTSQNADVQDRQSFPANEDSQQSTKQKPRGRAQPQRRSQRLLHISGNSQDERTQMSSIGNYNQLNRSQSSSEMQNVSPDERRKSMGVNNYHNNGTYQTRRQISGPSRPPSEERLQVPVQRVRWEPRQENKQERKQGQERNKEVKSTPLPWSTQRTYVGRNTSNFRNPGSGNISKTPRQSVFRAPNTTSYYPHPALPSSTGVYDFSDKISPVMCHQKPNLAIPTSRYSNVFNSRKRPGQDNEYMEKAPNSRESSPSLSVTKIIIEKKLKHSDYNRMDAALTNLNTSSQYKEYDDDFLNILGSSEESDLEQVVNCRRGSKHYSAGTIYSQVTESIRKKRKNFHI